MRHFSVFIAVAASLLAAPLLAGPPAKRPTCQVAKTPSRDVRRPEPCRRAPVPPVIDPTPMYLVSTTGAQPRVSDLT
jgi:hypothetical protein